GAGLADLDAPEVEGPAPVGGEDDRAPVRGPRRLDVERGPVRQPDAPRRVGRIRYEPEIAADLEDETAVGGERRVRCAGVQRRLRDGQGRRESEDGEDHGKAYGQGDVVAASRSASARARARRPGIPARDS